MNRLTRLLIPTLFGVALMAPLGMEAQHRGASRSSQTTRTSERHGNTSRSTAPRRGGSTRPGGSSACPGGSSARPGGSSACPGGSSACPGGSSARPGGSSACPGGSSARPGGSPVSDRDKHRYNGSAPVKNTGNSLRNEGAASKPRPSARPGNSTRPGHNDRPGHNNGGIRPGHNDRPGFRPGGNSAPRPGSWSHSSRPHYKYRKPGYRPPRPGGGYWGPPAASPYRINYWVPPVPRYVRVLTAVPSIGTVLGLTFGSFIDAGINSLFNAGYTVTGYLNNAIYLSNVRQLGYLWPEAMVLYTDGLMSGTQFYNWTAARDQSLYYNLYNQLTARYGTPVDVSYSGTGPAATWWGGGNTGYITLSYGYGASATGMNNYYTSLTYTAY